MISKNNILSSILETQKFLFYYHSCQPLKSLSRFPKFHQIRIPSIFSRKLLNASRQKHSNAPRHPAAKNLQTVAQSLPRYLSFDMLIFTFHSQGENFFSCTVGSKFKLLCRKRNFQTKVRHIFPFSAVSMELFRRRNSSFSGFSPARLPNVEFRVRCLV